MPRLPTFDAPVVLHLALVWHFPLLEAPVLLMPHMIAFKAFHHVSGGALLRLMAPLVALEAHLLIAFERLMGVLAAEDAIELFRLIWAVF